MSDIESLVGEVFYDSELNANRKILSVKIQGTIAILETEIVEYFEYEKNTPEEQVSLVD